MQLYKRYVEVITLIDKEGSITPLYLIWENKSGQHTYKVDKIINVRKAKSSVGGCGILYQCKILGHTRNLFYERNRWFIESHKP